MRKAALVTAAVAGMVATALSGCSSSSKGGSGGKFDVGVILPDTTTSNRYTLYDAPLLGKAFKAAGLKADIQNAHGSTETFSSDAQNMINEGVKVLLIDPSVPATGITVEKEASKAGVKVIDYDRVNLGGSAQYYVSFDNEKVGEQQATGLLACLGSNTQPNIIELNGGTDIDNNAVLFKAGATKVFQAKGITPKVNVDVKGWDNGVAATDFQQAFVTDPNPDAVLAANDGIAGAAIATLKQHNLKIPVTGQDATVTGIQFILTGDQCLTIFKNVKLEADAAAKLAIDLIKGNTADANKLASGSLQDPVNHRTIPSLLLPAEVITKSNINDVIKAGALTAAQICKGYTTQCKAAGIGG